MLLRSIRSQYVDPELSHELMVRSLDGGVSLTEAGRTLLATASKCGTSVISFVSESDLINSLLQFSGEKTSSSSNLHSSSAVVARLAKLPDLPCPVLLLNAPPDASLIAVVFAVADIVVLAQPLSLSLLTDLERLLLPAPPISDFSVPALVLPAAPGTAAVPGLQPTELVDVGDMAVLAPALATLAAAAGESRPDLPHFVDKVVAAANAGRRSLLGVRRATQQEALEKALFWTRKVLAREIRKLQDQLPLLDDEFLRASETLRLVAEKEWRKWASGNVDPEIADEISSTISDLTKLNGAAGATHNEAVVGRFAEQGDCSLAAFDAAMEQVRGNAATRLCLQRELVRLVFDRLSVQVPNEQLAILQTEADRSAAVMTAAETRIAVYAEHTEQLEQALSQAAADVAAANQQVARLTAELKAAVVRTLPRKEEERLVELKVAVAPPVSEKRVAELKLAAAVQTVTCEEGAAASATEADELARTVASLEAQLAETRTALEDEHRRNELLIVERSDEVLASGVGPTQRRSIFACFSRN